MRTATKTEDNDGAVADSTGAWQQPVVITHLAAPGQGGRQAARQGVQECALAAAAGAHDCQQMARGEVAISVLEARAAGGEAMVGSDLLFLWARS